MYSRNSFGDFYPVSSIVHKINPVIKFISFIICVFVSITSSSFEIHFFALSLMISLIIFSNVPIRFYFNTLYSLRFIFILLFLVFHYFQLEFNSIILIYMKIILIVEYLNIITYTTSSSELFYGISTILSMFNIFFINLDKITLMVVNLLRFIPLFITTEYKILKTQASRGIDYNNSDMFGKMYAYTNSLKNVGRLYRYNTHLRNEVSNIRMFNIKRKRTNLRANYVKFNDLIFLAFHIVLLVGYAYDRGILQ